MGTVMRILRWVASAVANVFTAGPPVGEVAWWAWDKAVARLRDRAR
jgi:hypothetical protein